MALDHNHPNFAVHELLMVADLLGYSGDTWRRMSGLAVVEGFTGHTNMERLRHFTRWMRLMVGMVQPKDRGEAYFQFSQVFGPPFSTFRVDVLARREQKTEEQPQ